MKIGDEIKSKIEVDPEMADFLAPEKPIMVKDIFVSGVWVEESNDPNARVVLSNFEITTIKEIEG
jgi:hypothetical protein